MKPLKPFLKLFLAVGIFVFLGLSVNFVSDYQEAKVKEHISEIGTAKIYNTVKHLFDSEKPLSVRVDDLPELKILEAESIRAGDKGVSITIGETFLEGRYGVFIKNPEWKLNMLGGIRYDLISDNVYFFKVRP